MSIVSDSEILAFFGLSTSSDDVLTIRDEVEDWIKRYCRREFESTTYTLEKYDGKGNTYLFLKNSPIINITRLAIGTLDALAIRNTNVSTTASVSVTSTGISLTKDDVTNSTVTFAANTTLSSVVVAINLLAGWEAKTSSSTYDSYKSTSLIKKYGLNAINNNWVYLLIPNESEDNFEVYEERGAIYNPFGFPQGNNNVFVSYTAGYSSSTMPDDLKVAVKIFCKQIYQKKTDSTWNLKSFRIGDISYTYNMGSSTSGSSTDEAKFAIPVETISILSKYRKILC